jgi:hypothetical protein
MPTLVADSSVVTYQDAIDRLMDACGGNTTPATVRAIKQSILEAYDEIVLARRWRYFAKQYRLATVAPETGTLSYSASTGLFTIDTGTFPTWAELAILEVGEVRYLVKTRSSSTTLLADDILRPVDDIAAETSFTIYKDIHPLPWDFREISRPLDEGNDPWVQYTTLADWLESVRYSSGSGSPYLFAIAAHPYQQGRFVALTYPHHDSARTLDFAYQRYARPLIYNGFDSPCRDGTISASATATITGSSSAFESGMVGSILRWGRTATSYPDGVGGLNAYKTQSYITTYSSATSIVISDTVTVSASTKYTISDPLDLDRAMLNAFYLGATWKVMQRLKMPGAQEAERDYHTALNKARQADGKSMTGRSPWDCVPGTTRRLGVDGPDDFS